MKDGSYAAGGGTGLEATEMPWAVVIDRPFYPRIDAWYGTEALAIEAARKFAAEEVSEGGKHESKVYVMEAKAVIHIATDY